MMAKEKSRLKLIDSLNVLFYFTMISGCMPYSLFDYRNRKIVNATLWSAMFAGLCTSSVVIGYHFVSFQFVVNDVQTGSLTKIIGISLLYFDPLMLAVDVTAFVINRHVLANCLHRMERIDDKLLLENISINYQRLRRLSAILIGVVTLLEVFTTVLNFFVFRDDDNELLSQTLWWLISLLPIYFSSLAKIWFIVLVYNVRQKFSAINGHLERQQKLIADAKGKHAVDDVRWNGDEEPSDGGYLRKEIFGVTVSKLKLARRIRQQPVSTAIATEWGIVQVAPAAVVRINPQSFMLTKNAIQPVSRAEKGQQPLSSFSVNDKMDKTLTNLCQLHDEICDIGKIVNRMFSFQMLILMAYGFVGITAQCYFMYCGIAGQPIPVLFRSAESLFISIVFIVYTGAKCVYVILVSWHTKMGAQKTGVQLHKVANVVDEDHCYTVINHLSLKLLNHKLNFTACGFFDLDMTTLYAITGAITSYLIILIQFNLAAQRTIKKPDDNATATISSPLTTIPPAFGHSTVRAS